MFGDQGFTSPNHLSFPRVYYKTFYHNFGFLISYSLSLPAQNHSFFSNVLVHLLFFSSTKVKTSEEVFLFFPSRLG